MSPYSPGVTLVWQIAALEATTGSHEYIEREHLFIGLAKAESLLGELESGGAGEIDAKLGDAQALKEELRRLGDCFRHQNVDTVKARQRARYLVDKGNTSESTNQAIHRSANCREAFARAAKFAGERQSTLHCLHLLAGLLVQPGVLVAQAVAYGGGDFEKLREAAQMAMVEFVQKAASKTAEPSAGIVSRYGTDLTQLARQGKIEPLVGRKKELIQLVRSMSRKTKNNPILVGEPGVGKTALVRALAKQIAEEHVPVPLASKRIIELNMSTLVAGTKYRGEFEERLARLIDEVKENPEIILFIDEIHTLVGAGAAAGGMDAANILKPALSSGDFRCIGSTTLREYRKYFENDKALSRRFLPLVVDEPSPEEALRILEELRERYEKHHGVQITSSALKGAVEFSCRYILDRQLPDKALDLLDEACVRAKIGSAVFRSREDTATSLATITAETIAEVISEQTGIPVTRLSTEGRQKIEGMAETLGRRVIGQPEAIEKVTRIVTVSRAGLRNVDRPVGVFLFLGPTGVGKTELCRALAEFLFGSEQDMIRLDMSEYKEKHSISRLIGAPPGYVGYEEEGQLTGRLLRKPYSVVLLDEIEKAHPEVCDLFLQLFDDGRLTDSHGKTVDGKNAIFIMTSNAVNSVHRAGQPIGFISPKNPDPEPALQIVQDDRQNVREDLSRHFRPEFLNRIDEVVLFNSLSAAAIRQIVINQLDSLGRNMREREILVEFGQEVVDLITRLAFDPAYGARPLARVIDRLVNGPLSQELIGARIDSGDKLSAIVEGDKVAFVHLRAETDSTSTV